VDAKQLLLNLSKLVKNNCLKKNEERWKFIYKKTIKALKKNFFVNVIDSNSKTSYEDFLEHYFGDSARRSGVPLHYFKDPLIEKYKKRNDKKRRQDEDCPKSINTRFLKLIFQSPQFVQDFFEYMHSSFKIEYLCEIPEKFFLIFKNYVNSAKNLKTSQQYFQNNKRCKLPWTFNDVDLAIAAMKEINSEVKQLRLARSNKTNN
jgi:hypothetical protein